MTKQKNFIGEWGKKIDWNKRVKSVCKPCWELKYCPYGPLVEDFPLKPENDEKSCRIFGHDCPVFYVAEPFTETKELRRITRSIPRTVQFKVLKRENQICRSCGNSVKDEDVEFDHIIPWSKGGPTEEHNIRLLCSDCNRKRGNRFESEYLINNVNDHLTEPYEVDIVEFFCMAINFGHEFKQENSKLPSAENYAEQFTKGEVSIFEKHVANVYSELTEFFTSKKPKELTAIEFKFLKKRWGFKNFEVYYLKDLCEDFNYEIEKGIELDKLLLNRLGIRVKESKSDLKKWAKY